MKILLYGDASVPDSNSRNIFVTLQNMGHEVSDLRTTLFKFGSSKARLAAEFVCRVFPSIERHMYDALVRHVAEEGPDLVIVADGYWPHPSTIGAIRRLGTSRIVTWFPDSIANFGRQYLIGSDYDAWFFKDRAIVEIFSDKLGKNAHFLPQAFNPLWHHPVRLTPREEEYYGCDLTIAGNLYYYRARMCEQFSEYSMKIWGNNAPNWLDSSIKSRYMGRYVAEEEKAKAFCAAKIVFNVMHYTELQGINLRAFEAAGCGAFQVIDWKPNIREFFEPDREIVTFRTIGELKDKVQYYLRHEDERQAIAERGLARALAEHTYEHRLKKMLSIVFGDDKSTNRGEAIEATA